MKAAGFCVLFMDICTLIKCLLDYFWRLLFLKAIFCICLRLLHSAVYSAVFIEQIACITFKTEQKQVFLFSFTSGTAHCTIYFGGALSHTFYKQMFYKKCVYLFMVSCVFRYRSTS